MLDRKMRNLSCEQLQFDEIWGFIGKKERHCNIDDAPEIGDVWTFCAIDPKTKLVPSFKVGKRDVVVLHLGPVTSPLLAVRAAIVEEFRNRESAEAE